MPLANHFLFFFSWLVQSSRHKGADLFPPHSLQQEALLLRNLTVYAKAKLTMQTPPGNMLDMSVTLYRLKGVKRPTNLAEMNELQQKARLDTIDGTLFLFFNFY